MKFISVGYGNMIAVDRVVVLASPESAPVKRLMQDAKDSGRVIDVSCGRRTRSVIITDSEHIINSRHFGNISEKSLCLFGFVVFTVNGDFTVKA